MLPGPAADVERLPGDGIAMFIRRFVSARQVVDVQHVAHLLAVAVDRDRLAQHRGDGEPGDPALVLDAELARAVDAGLAEGDRAQAVDAGVVGHVLVGGALRAAVGRVEVQRLRLGDAVRAGRGTRSVRCARRRRRPPSCRRPCWSRRR